MDFLNYERSLVVQGNIPKAKFFEVSNFFHELTSSPGFWELPGVLSELPGGQPWEFWQYGLWSFQTRGTKLERFLPKNQHTQRKLLNFENWVSGEVSKIGRHFSK